MQEKNLSLKENKREIELIADALANATRLTLIEEIGKTKGDDNHRKLADKLGVRSSAVTFHLNSLIAAGIIEEEESTGKLGRKSKNPKLKINKITIIL